MSRRAFSNPETDQSPSCKQTARSTAAISARFRFPIRWRKRSLLIVLSWSVMAFRCSPFTRTYASDGQKREILVVNGTTGTRLSSRFETSLLTTLAGLVLRISPPIEGSKATHQTSPRCGCLSGLIGDIAGQVFDPFRGLALARLIGSHRPVTLDDIALR